MYRKLMTTLLDETDGSPSQGSQSPTPSENNAPPDNQSTIDEQNLHRTDGAVEDDDQSSQDWAELSQPREDDEESPPPAPAKPPAQQPPPGKTQQPPQQSQAPDPGRQDQQTPPPGQQPPQEQPQQPPAQQPPAETPQQREERLQREAQEFSQQLEKYYQLPQDLAARLATEPEAVMPVLAAKVHQAVLTGVQNWMRTELPGMLNSWQQVQNANNESRRAFYNRWPSLRGHDDKVLEVAGMFAKMNPKATPQERMEKVGSIVCAALGINPDPAPGSNGSQPPPQQPRSNGQQPRAAIPPKPAGTRASNAGATPPPENIFAQMAEELRREDLGE